MQSICFSRDPAGFGSIVSNARTKRIISCGAMDEANKRLFVGCRLPARLVVLDTTSGRIVTSLPTVGDADDIFYDPGRHLVFVIGGEGAVEIFRQHDPDHYGPVQRITTAPGACACASQRCVPTATKSDRNGYQEGSLPNVVLGQGVKLPGSSRPVDWCAARPVGECHIVRALTEPHDQRTQISCTFSERKTQRFINLTPEVPVMPRDSAREKLDITT
jgi:hypothetical protein